MLFQATRVTPAGQGPAHSRRRTELSACDKFRTCNAPICPLDARWPQAVHLVGDKVCHYLLCTGKAGADQRLADHRVYRVVKLAAATVMEKWADIRNRVLRASQAGFKSSNLGVRTDRKTS
jgi:hypothetical protein